MIEQKSEDGVFTAMKTEPGRRVWALFLLMLLPVIVFLWVQKRANADDVTVFLTVGNWQREYIMHAPPNPGKQPMPVVFFFHGAGGTDSRAAQDYGWEAKADHAHFLAVFPQGLPVAPSFRGSLLNNPNIWRDGRPDMPLRGVDDDAFFRQMLADIEKRYPVDKRRIYVTGFSNGAGMTFNLGVNFADQVAAIAPVASSLFVRSTSLKRPVPMLYIIGTQDPLNPLAGGDIHMPWGGIKHGAPIIYSIETWRRWDGCPAQPKNLRNDNGVHCVVYGPGKQSSEVIYYTLDGTGHHWPGSAERLPASIVGTSSNRINATDVIWDFFAHHPIPR